MLLIASYLIVLLLLSVVSGVFLLALGFAGSLTPFQLVIALSVALIMSFLTFNSYFRRHMPESDVLEELRTRNFHVMLLFISLWLATCSTLLSSLFVTPYHVWIFYLTPFLLTFVCLLLVRYVLQKKVQYSLAFPTIVFVVTVTYTVHLFIIYFKELM
ncbi:hypothetical protein [Geomicrobium sediminis]|uniref:Uncharacterized protein YybS (DUF2232 family) n=1 Tax=Geomicrobium sediminis TaxID=1347788 RepID=A0ABS2PC98_9BACL|nr:hypothetical protein [Geomicrobium sediminis]MBM7633052.1 uncharacterized protein YybS (DUF2232 family) [Geomicrobium sediminis]